MNTAIILAGGSGKRLNNDTPKQFIHINNKMIIEYSIDAFNINKNINEIIVVCNQYWTKKIKEKYKNIKVVNGGKTRTESSLVGLLECNKESLNVLIHDAARPFISQNIINSSINYLEGFDCAIPVIKCDDSIINKNTLSYFSRDEMKIIQTPQAFNYKLAKEAYIKNNNTEDDLFTDNLSLILKYNNNINVKLFDGEKSNFKITTEDDLTKTKLLM